MRKIIIIMSSIVWFIYLLYIHFSEDSVYYYYSSHSFVNSTLKARNRCLLSMCFCASVFTCIEDLLPYRSIFSGSLNSAKANFYFGVILGQTSFLLSRSLNSVTLIREYYLIRSFLYLLVP